MRALPLTRPSDASLAALQAHFLSILPRIEWQAFVYFRGLRCPNRKDDAVQETVALAWKWFVRLVEQGKDPLTFPTVLAKFAARAVKCGRRICGQEKAKDVLSQQAQQRHGFVVEALPSSPGTSYESLYGAIHGQQRQDLFEERLSDNTQTPVPEQVAFRIDFPNWLATLTARERLLVHAMAQNERTLDLSRHFDLSPGRISQLRRELHNDWRRFLDDEEEPCSV